MKMRLDFTSRKLYGRDEEISRLQALRLETTKPGASVQACFVHGDSGSGKTSLCQQIGEVSPQAGYFISGKFDQFQDYSAPFSALVQAFDRLGADLAVTDDIRDCLAEEAAILTKIIPTFAKLLSKDKDDGRETLALATERLAVAFRVFLRKFCRPDRPLALFVDDLQWSDTSSLKILQTIVSDTGLSNFLFLGGYRDEGASVVTPLVDSVPADQRTDIMLKNLDHSDVDELVTSILSSDPERTKELSAVVYRKTLGNPYFAIQFMKTLHSQELLVYNFATLQWEWDMERVLARTDISENVVDVVTSRIQGLDSNTCRVLVLAACLGFYIDLALLEKLSHVHSILADVPELWIEDNSMKSEERDFSSSLSVAEEEGLIDRSGEFCKFSHDRVQQSVCELIPSRRSQDKIFCRISNYIRDSFDLKTNVPYLFIAADLLNRGSAGVTSEEQRVSLMELNYEAALASKLKAGVGNVAGFLDQAIKLSRRDDWKNHYGLMLEVFSMSARVEFSRGHLEECEKRIETILSMARTQLDTVRARIVRMESYGGQAKMPLAIKSSREIMSILGNPLPPSTAMHKLIEVKKTKRAVKGKDDSFFIDLNEMNSSRHKHMMEVLAKASVFGWSVDLTFAFHCYVRMIRICVENGTCEETAYGYAAYGFVMGQMGDVKEAFRYAQLAMKKTHGKAGLAAVVTMVHSSLFHFATPAGLSLEPLLSAYRAGLETGEIFYGGLCLAVYAHLYIYCGLPLGPLAADMSNFGEQLRVCHQDYALNWVVTSLHLAMNLTGQTSDPADFTMDALKKYSFFGEGMLNNVEDPSLALLDHYRAFNAFLLGDLSTAARAIEDRISRRTQRMTGSHVCNYIVILIEGLVGFAVWRERSIKKVLRLAKRALGELKACVKLKLFNCDGIYLLLKAENASFQRHSNIRPMYDNAISTLRRSGFIHFAAITNELAGKHMVRVGDEHWAGHYLGQAKQLYTEWGAKAKVAHLDGQYEAIISKVSVAEVVVAGAIRGRERFSPELDSLKSGHVKQPTLGASEPSSSGLSGLAQR